MITFIVFFGLSTLSLVINTIFYLHKETSYGLLRNKLLIFFFLFASTIFLIINLPYFTENDSNLFLEINHDVVIPTILFNLSNMFYAISVILNLLVFFQDDESIISLGIPSRISSKSGRIAIGRVLKGKFRRQKFNLSFKDLEKHMFICGATGTGKSNFLQNFLMNFTKTCKIPFFLVEFKGEYHFLQKKIEDFLIFRPGENFSINIFNPETTNPIIHAERIFDILKSGKLLDDSSEFSPQMEKVLVEILTETCKNEQHQNWEGFDYFCEKFLNENKRNIPMLSQTLISIKNRIRRFSKGPLKALFEENNNINIQELFKRRILLDLSSIIRLGGEKEDALFFLNMILKHLWDKNLMNGAFNFKGIKHLTIIEDAQYFAPQDLVKKNKLTSYLEDIALLQRGTGECLITLATRPDISKEILANNGIVLTFKNHLEKDIMCDLLNLNAENRHYLSILEEGQCIIRVNSIKEPFLLKVPYIKNESLHFSEIEKNNKLILEKDKIEQELFLKNKKNSISFYFKKWVNKIKGFLLENLDNKKKSQKNNIMEPLLEDHQLNGQVRAIGSSSKSDLEKKSYENLKSYITKLYKMQIEKE